MAPSSLDERPTASLLPSMRPPKDARGPPEDFKSSLEDPSDPPKDPKRIPEDPHRSSEDPQRTHRGPQRTPREPKRMPSWALLPSTHALLRPFCPRSWPDCASSTLNERPTAPLLPNPPD